MQRGPMAPEALKPISSGPGIQICDPVASGGDATLADFGSGCALWLQWSMGFHPQLGQTPRWELVGRAQKELHMAHLRLSLAQGSRLSSILGVTHVAIGQITGTQVKCQLTYQLYAVPSQKAVGAPIKLAGTQAQIVAQLPGVARALLTTLGVQKLHVPATVGARPTYLMSLGYYSSYPYQMPSPAEEQLIGALVPKMPCAALLSYVHHQWNPVQERETLALQLLKQAPGNFLTLGAIASYNAPASEEIAHSVDSQIAALAAPNNAVLASWAVARAHTTEETIKAYERIVRLAPHSATDWRLLALHYSEQGEAIRLARIFAGLAPQEIEKLQGIYNRWYYASSQATKLDPDYQDAWLEQATAATFSGDHDRADAAFWKALNLDKSDIEIYKWGLEMYQEKWGGDPKSLAKVARLAGEAVFPPASDLYGLGTELQGAGFPVESKAMFARAIAQQRDLVRQYPTYADVHAALGFYLNEQGQPAEAETELKAAIKLDPNSHYAHSSLGQLYWKQGRFAEAVVQCREDLRITNSIDAKTSLAETLVSARKDEKDAEVEEAQKLCNQVLMVQPNNYDARQDLGWIHGLKKEYDAALEMYGAAARLKPDYALPHREMGWIYRQMSRFDDAVREGRMAAALAPRDFTALSYLADTYAAKGDNEESIKTYRQAIDTAPQFAGGHGELGGFLLKIGKKEEGRAELKRALELNPSEAMKKATQDLLNKNP
jgi:tetratricopeptide (TPR) repeat protein